MADPVALTQLRPLQTLHSPHLAAADLFHRRCRLVQGPLPLSGVAAARHLQQRPGCHEAVPQGQVDALRPHRAHRVSRISEQQQPWPLPSLRFTHLHPQPLRFLEGLPPLPQHSRQCRWCKFGHCLRPGAWAALWRWLLRLQ